MQDVASCKKSNESFFLCVLFAILNVAGLGLNQKTVFPFCFCTCLSLYLHNIGCGSALFKQKTAFSFVTALAFRYICGKLT